jgi:SH3 domain protein
MKPVVRPFLLLLLVALPLQAAHITDQLLVGLYPRAETTFSNPIKTLTSGTPVEELKTAGDFTQVRLGNGQVGWVKSVYITQEKPAKAKLLEMQAKLGDLQQKLRTTEKELQAAKKAASQAKSEADPKQLTAAKKKVTELEKELKAEKEQVGKLKLELASARQTIKATAADADQARAKRITQLESELAAAEKSLKESSAKSDTASAKRIAQLESELADAKKNLKDSIAKSDAASAKRIGQLESELTTTRKDLLEAKSQSQASAKKVTQLESQLAAAKKALQSSADDRKSASASDDKVTALQIDLAKAKDELEKANAKIQRLESLSSAGDKDAVAELEKMENRLLAANNTLEEHMIDAELLRDQLLKLTPIAAVSESRQARITELEEELAKMQDQLSQTQQSTADVEPRIQRLVAQNQRLRKIILGAAEHLAVPEEQLAPEIEVDDSISLWYLLVLPFLLLFGFIGGIVFKNRLMRRRYGGFRV